MDESRTNSPLAYESPPRRAYAQRLAPRLLILAAAMFVINAVDYLGFDARVWFAPATKTTPARMEWNYSGLSFKFAIWHDDPTGSLLAASITAACVALLLVSAWRVRRGARWAAMLGIVVSLLLGVPLCFESIGGCVELLWGAWAVFHGGSEGIGLGVLQHAWLLCVGLLLLIAIKPLWLVFRARAVTS